MALPALGVHHPGLTSWERRYTLGCKFSAIPLFLTGIWSGWLILPNILHALTSFTPSGGSSNIIHATDYLTQPGHKVCGDQL